MNSKIILASASSRRKKLLEQIGITFEVQASNIEEKTTKKLPEEIVEDLALKKALDTANGKKNAVIIGADTIVYFNHKILGKPFGRQHAEEMLQKLSGQTHNVYTGVALVKNDYSGNIVKKHTFSVQTKVTFDTLDTKEIEQYIDSGSPMDKAGAYGIQDDWGAVFVKKINGDYYNVVGLPLNRFYKEIKTFEPSFFSNLVYEDK